MRGTSILAGLIVFTLALSACTAEMVATRKKITGPVKEVGMIDAGGGEVQYSMGGWLEKTRRADALMKIAEFCGGENKFKIVDEVDRRSDDIPYKEENEATELKVLGKRYPRHLYRHIYFECTP